MWNNPDSGSSGSITPTRTYHSPTAPTAGSKDGALSQTEAPATLVQTDNLTAADPNKDGKLTVHEFTRARMQDYEWADTNDNGLLELDEVVGAYQPQTNFLVQGFADSTGSEATNQQLSLTRAQVVAVYLGEQGIAPARMDVQGFGTTSAADSNATAAGTEAGRHCARKGWRRRAP